MSKVQLTIRIEENLLEKLKVISESEMRSLNSQYEYFLKKCISDYEKEHGTIQLSAE